jgi:hypothetical protein
MCVRVLRQIEHLSLPAIKGIHPLFLHSLDLFLPFTFIPSSPAGSSSGDRGDRRETNRERDFHCDHGGHRPCDGWTMDAQPGTSFFFIIDILLTCFFFAGGA